MNNLNHNTEELLTEIGENLKKTREEKKHSIDQISEELRIHPKFLEAIENSRISELPDISVFFSFLRSYAKFLDLDADLIIDRCKKNQDLFRLFQGEGLITRQDSQKNQTLQEEKQKKNRALLLKRSLLALFLIFLIFLILKWSGLFKSKESSVFCEPFAITAKQPVKIKIISKSVGLVEESILESGEKIRFIDLKGTKVQIDHPENALIQQGEKKLKWSKYEIYNDYSFERMKAYLFKCKD